MRIELERVVERLRGFEGLIDEAVAEACEHQIGSAGSSWSEFEVRSGLEELLSLKDSDCSYDRPSIGPSYALWHHGSRTNAALRALLTWLPDRAGAVRIVDLGCGTGATSTAVTMLLKAMGDVGLEHPTVTVDGFDLSPYMAETARRIQQSIAHRVDVSVEADFNVRSWKEIEPQSESETVIIGGYLLDQSDHDHASELAEELSLLAGRVGAEKSLFYTIKSSQLDTLDKQLRARGWAYAGFNADGLPLRGDLGECHRVRHDWYSELEVGMSWLYRHAPSYRPKEGEPRVVALNRTVGRTGPDDVLFRNDGGLETGGSSAGGSRETEQFRPQTNHDRGRCRLREESCDC